MSEKMQGIYASKIIEVCDLHEKELDVTIDECLDALKFSLKLSCEKMLENRKYPIEYKLDGIGTLVINEDGTRNLIGE